MSFLTGWVQRARSVVVTGWETVVKGASAALEFLTWKKPKTPTVVKPAEATAPARKPEDITVGRMPVSPPPGQETIVKPAEITKPIPQPDAEKMLSGFTILPTDVRSTKPIFGDQYQYQVLVLTQRPYEGKPGEPPPPIYEKWVTVTFSEPTEWDKVIQQAISFFEDAERGEGEAYRKTVVGVPQGRLIIYSG